MVGTQEVIYSCRAKRCFMVRVKVNIAIYKETYAIACNHGESTINKVQYSTRSMQPQLLE